MGYGFCITKVFAILQSFSWGLALHILLILNGLLNSASAFTIKRDTLENGFVILYSEAHKLPMVEIKIIVKAGSVYDPIGKEGLANLTARILLRGTEINTGDELLERIEYLGARIGMNTQEDFVEISARCLSKDLPRILEILSECLLRPAFHPEEFKKLQRQIYSQITSQMDDPFYAGQVALRKSIFGNHPLNHDPLGFDTTINNITQTDLKDFYNKYYAPNNAFCVLVGDFNSDSAKMLIEKYFSRWQRKDTPEFSIVVQNQHGKKGKIIKRDISQSYIFLGFLGPDNKKDDWIPTRIMNYILGGSGTTSRLGTEIREKRGLAYSVYSFFDRFNYGGYFIAGVQTKNESADEAIKLLIQELRRLPEDVSVEELNRAKKYYIGNFPLRFDTYGEMANFITKIEIEGLGLDYGDKFENEVSLVDLNDIIISAKKYLQPDNFCLVIVGNIDEKDITIEGIEWIK